MDDQRPAQGVVKPSDAPPTYRAYLVRCWQERNSAADGEPIWRFSLDASWYEERHGFASLQALMEHLQTELMDQDSGPAAVEGQSSLNISKLTTLHGGSL